MANRFLNNIRINDEYTLPSQDGTADQIIKTDGSGNLSFVDSNSLVFGADTLDDVTTRGNTTSNSVQVGAVTVTGNLTVDSNILYVDSVGDQVGIGTNNPTALLDVAADAKINSLTIGKGTSSVLTNSAFGLDALLSNTTGSENIAGGYEALKSNTSGYNNSAFGHKALKNNLGGFNNTAIGESSLISNTSGLNNTAIGQGALYSNTSGTNNTGIGVGSLFSNTTGQRNSAYGQGSLQNNTTGRDNSAHGSASLYNNTTGLNNVGFGLSALYYNTSGSRNIGIGREAGYDLTTGSNNTIIGSIPGTAGLSDTVIIGAGTVERLRIDSNGDSTFYGNITVNDDYTLPIADGTADQVIRTDGAGNLSFVDATSLVTTAESGLVYYEVKNSSGSTINKGKAVMAVGTDGNSGHILIDEMVADGSVDGIYFIGVLETTLDNGDIGRVIHFGELDQFNTLGQNGETWSDGDVLWLDPVNDGDFTITEPNGPNYKMAVAIVKNAATNGKIHIRVQGNEGVHDLHDVKLVSPTVGDLLIYDDASEVWENTSQNTGSAKLPTGTTAERPSSPQIGSIRYNTSTKKLELYNEFGWWNIGPTYPTDGSSSIITADSTLYTSDSDEAADQQYTSGGGANLASSGDNLNYLIIQALGASTDTTIIYDQFGSAGPSSGQQTTYNLTSDTFAIFYNSNGSFTEAMAKYLVGLLTGELSPVVNTTYDLGISYCMAFGFTNLCDTNHTYVSNPSGIKVIYTVNSGGLHIVKIDDPNNNLVGIGGTTINTRYNQTYFIKAT